MTDTAAVAAPFEESDVRVVTYCVASGSVSFEPWPPGRIELGVVSAEGETVWRASDGCLVVGSLSVVLSSVRYMTKHPIGDQKASLLRRAASDVVTAALASKASVALPSMVLDFDRLKKAHAAYKRNTKRKMDDLTEHALTEEKAARVARESYASMQARAERAEAAQLVLQHPLSSDESKRADCGVIYGKLMGQVLNEVYSAAHRSASVTRKSVQTRAFRNWEFEGVRGYEKSGDPGFVRAFDSLRTCHIEILSQTNLMRDGQVCTGVVSFQIDGRQYQAMRFGANQSKFSFAQKNDTTGVMRSVRFVTSRGSKISSDISCDSIALEAIAGDVFLTSLEKATAMQWLMEHDFSSFAHPILAGFDEAGLNVLLAKLGDLFGYCSGRKYRFQMDPAKCEAWIKPSHLQHILRLVVEGEFGHFRLVAHATSEASLASIRDDPIGLNMRYGNPSCRHGRALYVATTYEAGEGMYNRTSVKGKTLLMLLFSPFARLSECTATNDSVLSAYNFYCKAKDMTGNMYCDAIAVSGNDYLLPLGVVSP
tara:strand:- start:934 stop:2550 length:1617 start_codon:yes stop_codon:yes gene_type:complete